LAVVSHVASRAITRRIDEAVKTISDSYNSDALKIHSNRGSFR
jgi:hypothetical protein